MSTKHAWSILFTIHIRIYVPRHIWTVCNYLYVVRKFSIKGKKESTVKKNLYVNANSKQAHARARTYTCTTTDVYYFMYFRGTASIPASTTWNKSFVFSSYVPALFSRALPNRPITVSRIQVKYSTDTK